MFAQALQDGLLHQVLIMQAVAAAVEQECEKHEAGRDPQHVMIITREVSTASMFCRLFPAVALAAMAFGANVPAGTDLHVRLVTKVSSDVATGQPVQAVVVAPVIQGETVLLPAGLILSGKTADVQPAQTKSDTVTEQAAHLRLVFDRIGDKSGHGEPIECKLTDVENARETVDATGLITGITPSETIEARIDQGIGKLAQRSQQLAGLLSTLRSSVVKPVDPSITFEAGADATVELTQALTWSAPVENGEPQAITPADRLATLVSSEPFRTRAENPPSPSDLTNLMFIGTEDQIRKAFESAGWSSAAQLAANSKVETARAIIEDRGYSQAPVSVLLLDEKPPDLVFQKQNDTFSKRDHIRIWRRPDSWRGQARLGGRGDARYRYRLFARIEDLYPRDRFEHRPGAR